jgi:hypothetical protein
MLEAGVAGLPPKEICAKVAATLSKGKIGLLSLNTE